MNRKILLMRQTIRPVLLALLLVMAGPVSAQMAVGFGGVAHDASQRVEVVADSLTIDQVTGRALFVGNVVILQGDLRIAAEQVEVISATDNGSGDVQEVIASGGVLVTRGEDAAEGDSARYEIESGILTMTGNVLVTQDTTTLAGDSMTIDMATGNGTVDGRVRTVLTPVTAP